MKWLIRIALIVVLLVLVAAGAAFLMIDSIAATVVREGAAFATETDVEVEQVDVQLFGSAATITNLDIKNPNGPLRDKHDSFLVLGTGAAQVTAGSVMSDLIEVPKVQLSEITITLVGINGEKNYETILKSLKRFKSDEPPAETKKQKKAEIKLTTVSKITVIYDFDEDPVLGAAPIKGTLEIAFDQPLVFENLGQGGVPISQITADLITDIMVQVTANMGDQIGDHILGLTGSLGDTIGVDELKEAIEDIDLDLDLDINLPKNSKDLFNGILGDDDDKED